MTRRRGARAAPSLLFAVLMTLVAPVAFGQDPILRFSLSPDDVTIPAGGAAELRLRIENVSIREADDVAVSWTGPEAFALDPEPEPIPVLGPFETTTLRLGLSAVGAPQGEHRGGLMILYTYCIEDECYQELEVLDVSILVVAPAPPTQSDSLVQTESVVPAGPVVPEKPTESTTKPFPWIWVGFAAAIIAAAALLAGARTALARRIATVCLIVVAAGSIAYGVARNQHEQAQSIGSVLCVSCVGLEEAARPEEVRLSAAGVEALAALDRDVKLTVFYAEWCHSCPAAERLVELVADASEHITYRFVDVEASPEEALAAGIVESDRTIVPAIVMEGSPTVLFGISDLEDRLLDLLGVGR